MKTRMLLVALSLFFMMGSYGQLPVNPVQPISPNHNIPPGTLPLKDISSQVQLTKTVAVVPGTLTNLCPHTKVGGGNNNFDNHKVTVTVNIHYTGWSSKTDSIIKAVIYFSGWEDEGDRSKVEGRWELPVYTAPAGYVITGMTGGDLGMSFSFSADPDRPGVIGDYGACKGTHYGISRNNLGYALTQNVLRDIIMAVDITGDDFKTTEGECNCGFRIKSVSFNTRQVTIKKK